MKQHYHVLSGISGYMPDSTSTYATKHEAMRDAKWYADLWREDGYKVHGNMKVGYWVDRTKRKDCDGTVYEYEYALDGYIDIVSCVEVDCYDEDGELRDYE